MPSIIQDHTMIRQLSEDFIQLADRSQDAIYQFDIESQTFSFFNRQFFSLYAIAMVRTVLIIFSHQWYRYDLSF